MFPLSCSLFSWMSGTWSSSWLAVRPCSQKTHQCGSKTWQDTSTSIWLRQKQSPHSAAMLTVGQTHTLFCFKARLRRKYHAYSIKPQQTVHAYFMSIFSVFLSADYPYCLTGKELKGVIKGLIGRCSDILPDFFDHCVYTMLRELDRQSGRCESAHGGLEVVCAVDTRHKWCSNERLNYCRATPSLLVAVSHLSLFQCLWNLQLSASILVGNASWK